MVPPRLAAALGLDPAQCAVLRVQGESMAPTLPAGSSILIDRSRTRRRDGQTFVVRAADGLVVKRAGMAAGSSRAIIRRGSRWRFPCTP